MSRFRWTGAEVNAALRTEGPEHVRFGDVTTDSRAVREGDLFVALRGDRFDGHDFLEAGADAGLRGAVVRSDEVPRAEAAGLVAYGVEDTLWALGALATHRRRALRARVVGITGSSGKTTTKEFAKGALAGSLSTHATQGNLNNRIGLPLTLLDTPDEAEVVLLEMGTNQPGEIGMLTAIAEPELGVVTTVGEAHLEGLGSLEGVLDEKLALVRGLPDSGVALVGDDPALLPRAAHRAHGNVRVAGWTEHADEDLRPEDASADESGHYAWTWHGSRVRLRVPGRAAVVDALLALALSEELGVPSDRAVAGLNEVRPVGMRGRIEQLGELRVLVDCYNANPQSMRAALELLRAQPATHPRVAVLGSMLELGAHAPELHARVLDEFRAAGLALVAVTGAFAEAARRTGVGDDVLVEPDVDRLADLLSTRLRGDEAVLLKASRGVRLERVLDSLRATFGAEED